MGPIIRRTSCNRYKHTLYQPACFMLTCQRPPLQSFMLLPHRMVNHTLHLLGITPRIIHCQILLHFRPRSLPWTYQSAPTLYQLPLANRLINLPNYPLWQIEAADLPQNTGETLLKYRRTHEIPISFSSFACSISTFT